MSEYQHFFTYLTPLMRPLFLGDDKPYDFQLDRATLDSRKRPDFSCLVDEVPILNSEIKPLGYYNSGKLKDFIKVHLRARKAVNQQAEARGGPCEAIMFTNFGMSKPPFFYKMLLIKHCHISRR
jgi:hypothetical protein